MYPMSFQRWTRTPSWLRFRLVLARARRAIAACLLLYATIGYLDLTAASANGPQARDSWSELGFLNIGRFGCRVHSIDGSRAIVIAGSQDEPSPAQSSAEILNLESGDWTLAAPMPAGFKPGANPWTASLTADYFLVAGGFNAVFSTESLASYIYSVSRNTWIRAGDLPSDATLGSNVGQIDSIVLDDGRVLIAGGLAIGGVVTKASLVFTPNYANLARGIPGAASGSWDFTRDRSGNITQLSGPTEHHKLIKLKDGRVLLIAGYDQLFGFLFRDTPGVQAELFDPGAGTWTPLPNMPAVAGEDDRHDGVKGVRQLAAVALLRDGRVLVSGGFSLPTDDNGVPLLEEIAYDRSSSVLFDPDLFDRGAYPWSTTGSMQAPRSAHAMGNLNGSGGVLAARGFSGFWEGVATPTAEIFDPARGMWSAAAGLPADPGSGLPISLPLGCTEIMPGGRMLVVGGVFDLEAFGTSRRTYLYRP